MAKSVIKQRLLYLTRSSSQTKVFESFRDYLGTAFDDL